MFTRRQALISTLFGAGAIGLRSLATGLPASFLLNPRRALADMPDGGAPDAGPAMAQLTQPQFVVFSTSGNGDPINASVPGTYEDPNIVHSADPSMAPTPLTILGQTYTAAAPWASLPQSVLDRTCFWHLMTNTPVHPKEPDVLKLMETTQTDEMFPSILAKLLAPVLGTIQAQPITVGASSPSEGLTFGGQALPIIPPLALRATLTSAAGPLTDLQPLRDQTLDQLYALYRSDASAAGKAYIDSMVASQAQVRSINLALLNQLSSIKDNSIASQVTAAVTLIQMKVTPVVAIHVPFGGDNHRDVGLATETAQTVSGVAAIATLMNALAAAGLTDQVTFLSLNVFGRTIGPGNTDGRQHNLNHQVSLSIGKYLRGGVVGGVAPVAGDYGCLPLQSTTGQGSASGDIPAQSTLGSFGQTVLASLGVDAATVASEILSGKVISGALA